MTEDDLGTCCGCETRENVTNIMMLSRRATAANPAKSNRAIAKEIGVSDQTVRRGRRQLEDAGNDVALDHAPPK